MKVTLLARLDAPDEQLRSYTWLIEGVSRSLTHQLVRHRLGSFSQMSQRYVDMKNADFIIPPVINENPRARDIYDDAILASQTAYELLRDMGIRKEDARYVLPEATETSLVMTLTGWGWHNFLQQRLDKAAQWEIRELAQRMKDAL